MKGKSISALAVAVVAILVGCGSNGAQQRPEGQQATGIGSATRVRDQKLCVQAVDAFNQVATPVMQ